MKGWLDGRSQTKRGRWEGEVGEVNREEKKERVDGTKDAHNGCRRKKTRRI